jgi:HSP20 family protein
MELVRWEPFEGLNRLHSRINDLFDENFGRASALPTATAGTWLPPLGILEGQDSYLLRAELPGMKKEDFNLEVNDGTLTLSGEASPKR